MNTCFCTGLCSDIAPVEGAIKGVALLSSSGMIASALGVPRLSSRAITFFSSIRMREFSAERLGSNPSSRRITSIFSPWMPPCALTWSMTSCEPRMVSFTLAATGPDMSADWPIRIWAAAFAALRTSAAAQKNTRTDSMGCSPEGRAENARRNLC